MQQSDPASPVLFSPMSEPTLSEPARTQPSAARIYYAVPILGPLTRAMERDIDVI